MKAFILQTHQMLVEKGERTFLRSVLRLKVQALSSPIVNVFRVDTFHTIKLRFHETIQYIATSKYLGTSIYEPKS